MSEDSAPYDTDENEHPINLEEHLEKLVREWRESAAKDPHQESLREVLGLLGGQRGDSAKAGRPTGDGSDVDNGGPAKPGGTGERGGISGGVRGGEGVRPMEPSERVPSRQS